MLFGTQTRGTELRTPDRPSGLFSRLVSRVGSGLAVSTIGVVAAAGLIAGFASVATAQSQGSSTKADDKAAPGGDKLIMRKDGKVIVGTIVSETATTVKFRGEIAGIAYETEYSKADILEIKRAPKADAKGAGKPEAKPEVKAAAKTEATPAAAADAGAPKVYVIELTGKFGRDISQTPIRDAVKDAQRSGADVLIFSIENDWSADPELKEIQKGDDAAEFDQLLRAEDMDAIFTDEIPRWEKPPRVAFWVKRAMGGAGFLPLVCKELYFSSEGKIGGLGNLGELLAGVGDDVVQHKQRSLRLGHAEGMARSGDHPYEIVRALAIKKYVLCVSFEGGKVVYHERMPENAGEMLLTDDGDGDNKDTSAAIVSGEGNDVLTLTAKIARDIQISQGTADSLSDLLFAMDLPRNAVVVKGRTGQIMQAWTDGVNKAERDIRRLLQEVDEVQMGSTFEEQSKGRGLQKAKLQEILNLLNRYGEAFGKGQVAGLRAQITDRIKSIDNQQQREYQIYHRKK